MENETNINGNVNSNEGAENQNTNTNENVKTFTEDEVSKMIDKRISDAYKKWQIKADKQQSEAEKLRTMSDEQKREYEFDKKVKELENKEREFNLMSNKVECSKILNEKGLPQVFLDFVVAEDADTMSTRINDFDTAFRAAVNDEVSKRLSGASNTPKTGAKQTGLTKESFKKMSLSEKQNLFVSNPTLYNSLIK